jgi:hypothetical protein
LLLLDGIIPSRPTIPRRNSASNKLHHTNSTPSAAHHDLSVSELAYTHATSQLMHNDDDDDESDFNRSAFSTSGHNTTKYDTMPNLRTSAKNRKKLEKLFSVGGEDTLLSGNKNTESNLYLSKLKAAEKHADLNSSRYTPSNPESGIFSMSDYDQIEASNRTYQAKQKSQPQPVAAQRTPQSNPSGSISVNNASVGSSGNSAEYNPLAGVSFKATHGSDVEIVGVRLGNTGQNGSSEQALTQNGTRKKASFSGRLRAIT